MAKIFDGAAEARLIALGSSHPLEGHAPEPASSAEQRVELGIVERASDESLEFFEAMMAFMPKSSAPPVGC
jgi:hypothetical protein